MSLLSLFLFNSLFCFKFEENQNNIILESININNNVEIPENEEKINSKDDEEKNTENKNKIDEIEIEKTEEEIE